MVMGEIAKLWLGNSDVWSRLTLLRLQRFPLNPDRSKQTRRTWADTVDSLGQPQAITREERSLYLRETECMWSFTLISPMKTMAQSFATEASLPITKLWVSRRYLIKPMWVLLISLLDRQIKRSLEQGYGSLCPFRVQQIALTLHPPYPSISHLFRS